MQAGGAHPARVERVPFVPAVTRPSVFLARHPTAEWASDARAGFLALVQFGFTINNNTGLVDLEGGHASIL
jgi:hypothetical protein